MKTMPTDFAGICRNLFDLSPFSPHLAAVSIRSLVISSKNS
jgi:hypothetical protein